MIDFFDALIGCKSRAQNKNGNLESRAWILKFTFLAQKERIKIKRKGSYTRLQNYFRFLKSLGGYVNSKQNEILGMLASRKSTVQSHIKLSSDLLINPNHDSGKKSTSTVYMTCGN